MAEQCTNSSSTIAQNILKHTKEQVTTWQMINYRNDILFVPSKQKLMTYQSLLVHTTENFSNQRAFFNNTAIYKVKIDMSTN